MPVLVDLAGTWPGKPLPPWPPVDPEVPTYTPPTGQGRPRLTDANAVASWLAILAGLTPHGLRHGHQTWMDEVGTSYVLQADRMGHEVPGMRGVYSHISNAMRTALIDALQEMWEASLDARLEIAPRSPITILDTLLRQRAKAKKAA